MVQFKDQVLDDKQAWANDYFVRLEHKVIGGMTAVGPPVKFDSTPLAVQGPTPQLGEHTRAVLSEAGVSHEVIEALFSEGKVREPNDS